VQRIVLLTEGFTEPGTAKTASSVLRYRRESVVAILDRTEAGRTAEELLETGGDVPVVASLDEIDSADTLVLGIAPPGGRLPESWRPIILAAISRGMNIVNGLHHFLVDDTEFVQAAEKHNVELHDLRRNNETGIAQRKGLSDKCLRIHTVGHDCSVGKMLTAIELTKGLQQRGHDSHFVATGQTGILVSGGGIPMDRVISDFVNGAAERLVLENQHHEMLIIEGQGSLVHPSYSGVTLGMLHGFFPHALIMCYEVGRKWTKGVEHVPIPPLAMIRELYETMAGVWRPCPVIGIAMNSRLVDAAAAELERERIETEFGLPVCDVVRHGPEKLIDAIVSFNSEREVND
jgi:uncharacterized NAD-dependent epimerase/dehydratase family protein